MHDITFLPHQRKATVGDGETLLRAAMDAGVHINASCGGEGVCGKCRVMVEQGDVQGGLSEQIRPEDAARGCRLACRAVARSDAVIRVPVESAMDAGVLKDRVLPRRKAAIRKFNFNELREQGLLVPPVEKRYLDLPVPDVRDHQPDVGRVVDFLRRNHDEHRLELNLPVIRIFPDVLREQDFKVTVTLERPVRKEGKTRLIHIQAGDTRTRNYAIALDVGTTTVFGQLVDLSTGELLAEQGDFNGQIGHGEDVITRIIQAEKPGGLQMLHEAVVRTINGIIGNMIDSAGVDPEDINAVTIAGNTTMTQLLLKVTPRYIRRSPYVPASTMYPPVKARDLGLDLACHATALVFPQVSSYVGGDIVAGVMGAGMHRTEKLTLFMDVGTNAEIVVGNRDWMACAACSAGPAFEGGGVTFGMRAAKGAIEDFSMDPSTLEPMLVTIGDARPTGICGSGLIVIVAVLFETGVIDSRGKFNRELHGSRVRRTEGVWEYVLAWKDETRIGRDITISEIDIDNLIRAKGAIYSGCQTLLHEVGLSMDTVEQVILAGGFGSYVDLEKAMTIGLLPEIDPEKVTFIGNGALLGARISALTNRIRQDVVRVTRMMTSFELSETASYMEHYIAALFLPHTDMTRFPGIGRRMEERRRSGERTAFGKSGKIVSGP